MVPLTNDQLKFYKKNGYLIVPKYFTSEQCDNLVQDAKILAKNHYANILNIHSRSMWFFNLLTNPLLLQMADQIQNAKMIPLSSIFFFCKPNNPLELGSNMHQDNYAAKAPYGSYFIISVAFDDADKGNGSLIVYPGSHKCGELPNVPSKNFEIDESGKITKAFKQGNAVEIPKKFKPLQLSYEKGSLLFLHGHIIHGAPQNKSPDRWRRKIYMHYIKDGDPFWPGWTSRRQLIDREKNYNSWKDSCK